jgi:hypothetical protein
MIARVLENMAPPERTAVAQIDSPLASTHDRTPRDPEPIAASSLHFQ